MKFLERTPRYLSFTGNGGIGKTSIACAAVHAQHPVATRIRVFLDLSSDKLDRLSLQSRGRELRDPVSEGTL